MLSVLRHYLPIRKALLILSETAILTLVLASWFTAHLWNATEATEKALARNIPPLSVQDAVWSCVATAFVLSLLAQLAIAFNELYDVRVSGSRYTRAQRFVESAGSAIGLTLLAILVLDNPRWGLNRILDTPPLTTQQRVQTLVFGMLSGFTLLYGWRSLFHTILRRANFAQRVLILGSGKAAHELAREILERPDAGYEVAGILPETATVEPDGRSSQLRASASPERSAPASSISSGRVWEEVGVGLPTSKEASAASAATAALVLEPLPFAAAGVAHESPLAGNGSAAHGHHSSLFGLAQRLSVNEVIVALADRRAKLPTEDLLLCRLAGVSVREGEALYEEITGKIAVEALRPSYLIFNEGFARHPWNDLAKRAVDVVLSSLILLLTWPLMLATAIAVRMDSEGLILFRQERVGRDGIPFTLLKFRSMRADAEKTTGPVWATEDDPRITRAGRFMRRTRLDELPQLFNVLAGQMSLVGPRPERPVFVEDLAAKIPYFRQRHIVKPGLTGWAQISYRYGASFEDAVQKLQYDLFYIKNQSLLFDLSILFNTVKTVILRKGT